MAPRSMTGYGRAEVSSIFGRLIVEMQSINRKFLEISIYSPKEISFFDIEIRKMIAKNIFRGQVIIRLFLYPDKEDCVSHLSVLRELKKKWDYIVKELKMPKEEISLSFLVRESENYLPMKDEKSVTDFRKSLLQGLNKALSSMIKMKKVEAVSLISDLKKRLKIIEKNLDKIEKKVPQVLKLYRDKLQKKLEEIVGKSEENEERILREVIIFAEKCDITEEIVRLRSHLNQLSSLFDVKEILLGRKMDFLLQEIMREINTIAAKSSDAMISSLVVEVKSQLEKIREQIQNIE